MKKKIICSILSVVMIMGLVLSQWNDSMRMVAASDTENADASTRLSSWRFSETVTQANDSSIWKAVFLLGNSGNPTGGSGYNQDLTWNAANNNYYSSSLPAFGNVYTNGLVTGPESNAQSANRRPAMQFTAPKTGTVKISLDNVTYQGVANKPVLLIYKIAADGTCENIKTYTDATSKQEHYYQMEAGEKLYVALQYRGSACFVGVDPVVSYVSGDVYVAETTLNEANDGVWRAAYNLQTNIHNAYAMWYAGEGWNCYRATNYDNTWGYIYKGGVQTGTNANRMPAQVFTAPKDGTVKLHINGIATNTANFQKATVFTRKDGEVKTIDTITAACAGKDYCLMVTAGEEIGISFANGNSTFMSCTPVVSYLPLSGDCNINGVIETTDTTLLRHNLVEAIELDPALTNVNCDYVTDVRDIVCLKKVIYENEQNTYGVNQVSADSIPEI